MHPIEPPDIRATLAGALDACLHARWQDVEDAARIAAELARQLHRRQIETRAAQALADEARGPQPGEPQTLLTVAEIAETLQLSVSHVRQRVVTSPGFPAPVIIGGRSRWRAGDLNRWIDERRT